MAQTIFIFLVITASIFSQKNTIDFHSPENKKKFADYLFCQGDYLRAVEEYKLIQDVIRNDTINFKIMLCYSQLNLYYQAAISYSNKNISEFSVEAQKLYLKNKFLLGPSDFHTTVSKNSFPFEMNLEISNYFLKLRSIYYIETRFSGIDEENLLKPFDAIQKEELVPLYDLSVNPSYKSPALAGILSAAIPGSGKMYAGEWGDGIAALLATGLLAFLAYDNFRANHNTRAWIFTGLGTFFYAGNIYGSVAAAQIFNARINFDFHEGIKLFLEQKNYFMPEYDFCN
ncbi:MAG: hypothetical protein WBQ32_01190 [Ignavibacteriaceae bacterium]